MILLHLLILFSSTSNLTSAYSLAFTVTFSHITFHLCSTMYNLNIALLLPYCPSIDQPCTPDVLVNNGVTQEQIDKNVLSIAELWLSPSQRETVYQARFTNRVPYSVGKSLDSRQNSEFLGVKIMRDNKCQSFEWFLKEIYPGLASDKEDVEIGYKNHLSSNYLERALGPILSQYEKRENDVSVNADMIAVLKKRERKADEMTFKNQKMKAIPPEVKEIVYTPTERHANLVRETLVCMDMPKGKPTDKYSPCEAALRSDPNACQSDKATMMFKCPQSCNLCGTDGKICFDFYEKKCPIWKEDGQCVSQEVELTLTCRKTCGFCTPAEAPYAAGVSQKKKSRRRAIVKAEEHEEVVEVADVKAEEEVEVEDKKEDKEEVTEKVKVEEKEEEKKEEADVKEVENHNKIPDVGKEDLGHNVPPVIEDVAEEESLSDEEKALALITTKHVVDPFVAQEQFKNGLLPDPPTDKIPACSLNDKSHGKLLAYMNLATIETEKKTPRVLCGIYTMEKNHPGNVQATRETWGKRCDGFIAFSTVTDNNIPSVNILHEGDEHYDNMWQKSRSIWKYIHKHYLDSFDYFLLGGDDMFYIVDNLKNYLMSDEIVKYAEESNGIFLGRRFWPGMYVDKRVYVYVCVCV